IELGPWRWYTLVDVGFTVLLGHVVRGMRRVGGEVAEERAVLVSFHELQGCIEENIRAVALEFFELAIVPERIVEIMVAPNIGSVADAAAAEGEDLVEAAILWTIGII